ncbi:MAG: hypothetical protein AB1478_05195 [Nitrospirota bacterium]
MHADDLIKIANEIKDEFKAISPFIQKHTSIVCASCEKVCCINKHGYYEKEDIIFISALGIDIPSYQPDRNDTDPCRFLTENGCSLQRWMRPFRCTWYFCKPLLKSMTEDNSKAYSEFIYALQRLISIRQKLTE